MQYRLVNQVPKTFHGPDSRGDLFGQFFNVVIPTEFIVNCHTK